MERVLFVCSGNTCRSPLAAGIFNRLVHRKKVRNLIAESAGVMAMEGMRASQSAISVGRRHDIDLSRHRSRTLTPVLSDRALLILTMTGEQWYHVTETAPRDKVFLLTSFGDGGTNDNDIVDPYGGSLDTYEAIFAELDTEISRCFDNVVQWLQDHAPQTPESHVRSAGPRHPRER
jgi:protein-tyrosine phosphatase